MCCLHFRKKDSWFFQTQKNKKYCSKPLKSFFSSKNSNFFQIQIMKFFQDIKKKVFFRQKMSNVKPMNSEAKKPKKKKDG